MGRGIRRCWKYTGLLALCYSISSIVFGGLANAGSFVIVLLGAAAVCTPYLWQTVGEQHKAVRYALVVAWGAVLLVVTLLTLAMLWAAHVAVPKADDAPRTVIVLGAKLRGNEPSLILKRRLMAARDYLLQQPEAMVVVSGGLGEGEVHTEAAVMRAWLEENGVAAARIFEEGQSAVTSQNIALSAEVIHENGLSTEVLLCTDGFHQLRSALFARKNDLNPLALSSATPLGLIPMYYAREWLALAKAVVLGS